MGGIVEEVDGAEVEEGVAVVVEVSFRYQDVFELVIKQKKLVIDEGYFFYHCLN